MQAESARQTLTVGEEAMRYEPDGFDSQQAWGCGYGWVGGWERASVHATNGSEFWRTNTNEH